MYFVVRIKATALANLTKKIQHNNNNYYIRDKQVGLICYKEI